MAPFLAGLVFPPRPAKTLRFGWFSVCNHEVYL